MGSEEKLDKIMAAAWGKEVFVTFDYKKAEQNMEKHLNFVRLLVKVASKVRILYHAPEKPTFPPTVPRELQLIGMIPRVEIRFITTEEHSESQRKVWGGKKQSITK